MEIYDIIRWLVSTLLVSGALWKGLDSIANAYDKRADALNVSRRLDFDQMQANYENAMQLIDRQAQRIDTLHDDIENYERRWGNREMSYVQEINQLKQELEKVREEHKLLLAKHRDLERRYAAALERIEKLEKGDTGPLSE